MTAPSKGILLVPTLRSLGILAAVGVVLGLVLNDYWVGVISLALVAGLFAFGLDILQGWTGLGSLGHAAWYGISAYAVAILTIRSGWNVWAAMLCAILISTTLAACFAPFAVRLKGVSFLVVTLAFGQVVWGLAVKLPKLTGGSDGMPGVQRPNDLLGLDFGNTRVMYALVLVVVLIVVGVGMRLMNGPLGTQLRGVRLSDLRVRSLGYNVGLLRFTAFVVSAAIAAIAGALAATLDGFVGTNYLAWTLSAEMLLAVMIGGPGALWGPFAAGFGIYVFRVLATDITKRWTLILGLLYIITVLVIPNGIASIVRRRTKRKTQAEEDAEMAAAETEEVSS